MIGDYLKKHTESLNDLAYTLGERRQHLKYRSFAVAENGQMDLSGSWCVLFNNHPEVILTFTGQGAQWPGMGRALLEKFRIVRRSVELMDEALQSIPGPPSWRLTGIFLSSYFV